MGRWHVVVQARGEPSDPAIEEARLRDFTERFAEHEGTVSVLDRSYEARFSLEGDDLADAFSAACSLFSAVAADSLLPAWPLGRIEVASTARAAPDGLGDLVGIAEAAAILGVSPSRTSHLTHRPDFPVPEAVLACGPVWRRSQIEGFAVAYRPKVGRPRKLV